ncbi:TVP38/TMEM64 family protein [Halobacillus naozhouensis]|uniref:TVP38/TMEM64 family membrane protein n=1 Tax=Halobacillus naozhouensis TaxID=554880 RepID=A0ABY8IW84_9BACI|nr:TVP38/TMEM64 family protein [Halobacillus naozhouensis]WFT74473.1 TVP38/TMEM64 family protein [Halobacillus naozhouensis]
MKLVVQTCGLFLGQLFSFYLAGLSVGLLLIQVQWIDMRFDSAYVVTVLMGLALWLCIVFLITEGGLPFFLRKGKPFLAVICFSVVPVIVTLINGSYLFMPAYITSKAWFLNDVLTISQMNMLLVAWFVLGITSLFFSRGLQVFGNRKELPTSQKIGIGIFSGTVALFVFFYLGHRDFQRAVNDAIVVMQQADVSAFRAYLLSFGPLAPIVSGWLMVFQSVIAPLPAFVITFANGLVFGWLGGALLSWGSAMAGAILCFYLAKWLGRPVVQRFVSGKALAWWDQFFQKYGSYSVLIARLVPIISFDLVSYAAGVTPITFWNFFWATGLGQLPATLLYSYLGETATDVVKFLFLLFTISIALVIIGYLLKPRFLNLKD